MARKGESQAEGESLTIDDRIIRAYLQAAHNRGGSFHMAMLMMASRLILLEDRLLRARVPFEEDKIVQEFGEGMPR